MKQLIIARKDLKMSPGKLAAQVSHASIAFLTKMIRDNMIGAVHYINPVEDVCIIDSFYIDRATYDYWINGTFTKIVCGAKDKASLEEVYNISYELGLKENIDYFVIKDNCLTELSPEEVDSDGVGRTITCIGFRPLPNEICYEISKNYQLY